MDKEKIPSPFHPIFHLPRTLGEKMVAAAVGIDASVIVSSLALNYLQREGITDLTPELTGKIGDILLWGGHILVSDLILKPAGMFAMVFLEDENWLRNRPPKTNSGPITDKFLVIDNSMNMNLQLEGLPIGAVPYIDKNKLKLGFLNSPHFWNAAISLVFRLYPKKEEVLGLEYGMSGQQLRDYLVGRSLTIIGVNRQFREGTLSGSIVELPYPNRQDVQPSVSER